MICPTFPLSIHAPTSLSLSLILTVLLAANDTRLVSPQPQKGEKWIGKGGRRKERERGESGELYAVGYFAMFTTVARTDREGETRSSMT